MSKHPEAQGDGVGHAPLDALPSDALPSDALPSDALPSDGLYLDAEALAAESSAEGHSRDRHSHDGHSRDGHSRDGHSRDGHSHRLHAHADPGAQAQHSQTAQAADAIRVPCIVIVDEDVELCEGLSLTIGASCHTHCVAPARAVALLQSLPAVDVALVDCDPPPSVQAPIFGELARWPSAICVLMSANVQKVEQFRALGVFAPLVLDKPVHPEALEAIRSATLELCRALG